MKKTYDKPNGQELSKKLFRSISDQAKRLDDARSCVRCLDDLFAPNLIILRRKLGDYCERLIFSEPILWGRKCEEIIWRKCFYDVVATVKKLKQLPEYQQEQLGGVDNHIKGGIGFYHHFLSKLQLEFGLDLNNFIDFAVGKNLTKSNTSKEVLNWAESSAHRCLIYLGDLNRYKIEFYPTLKPNLAFRYYLQAISFKPEHGMPYNQMGTLAMSQNLFIDAVYHYFRCLTCKIPFEGTTNNLHGLFDRNSKFLEQLPEETPNADCIIEPTQQETIKKFLARFLLLIDIWYFNKKLPKVYHLCHQTFKNLEECLHFRKPPPSESSEQDSSETDPQTLTNSTLFKIVVICLITIAKLRQTNSQQLSTVVAFTLAIYSQLVRFVCNHVQESVQNYPLNEELTPEQPTGILKDLMSGGKKKQAQKLRRRKKGVKQDESEESDLSETENGLEDSSSDDDSFLSDSEDILANSESDDEDCETTSKVPENEVTKEPAPEPPTPATSTTPPVTTDKPEPEILRKAQRMDINDMLEIITEETPLSSIKILNDWLKSDPEVLKSCASNTRSLLKQITYFLNLININLSNPKITGVSIRMSSVLTKHHRIPLAEDMVLKGMEMVAESQKDLDWNYMQKRGVLNGREEAIVRIVKLISFGKTLTGIQETGVVFDEPANMFVCKENGVEDEPVKLPQAVMEDLNLEEDENGGLICKGYDNKEEDDENGGQMTKMKHMGQLWLAAEVRALESRIKGKPALSPYLVLDAEALIKYTFMVKQLVNSRKFIVLVPTAVVSALDDLKREKLEARDAIRWLESQFHRGNRFFRAQRAHEKAPIPYIKYPKKKDKEMHIYIQIIECCNFLTQQQKGASNLVTLLIGNQNVLSNGENREFSYVGWAQSADIQIESITQFYGKWKKSKGKR